MFTWTLIAVMLTADPVPVAGRPTDFSGAIGGPFVVTTTATPTEVQIGEPITFTVRITGPGDLSQMRRPDLEHDPEFNKRFTVEDGPDKVIAEPPGREFEYTLRPRSIDVKAIPRVKLVYFNPTIKPAERGFQTTNADAVEIVVRGPFAAAKSDVPQYVREWIEKNRPPEFNYNNLLAAQNNQEWLDWILDMLHFSPRGSNAEMSRWLIALAILLPPSICAAWYAMCRPTISNTHESTQLVLERLQGELTDPLRQIDEAIREFIETRIHRPLSCATADEIETTMRKAGITQAVSTRAGLLLRSCERGRFAICPLSPPELIVTEARQFVRSWESHQ